MPANGEYKLLISGVAHRVFNAYRAALEPVGDYQLKFKGIALKALFALSQPEGQHVIASCIQLILRLARKAVQIHGIFPALVGVFAVGQASADGKHNVGMARPVGRVALPKEFRAVAGKQTLHLRAHVRYRKAEFIVFYSVKHCFFPRSVRFLLLYHAQGGCAIP